MHALVRNIAVPAVAVTVIAFAGCNSDSGSAVLAPPYTVTTLAGSGTFGTLDGQGAAAQFNDPANVAVDASGTIYVADYNNNEIRKVTSSGAVTTFTSQAGFFVPFGITVTAAGKLYVTTDWDDIGGTNDASGTLWSIDTTTGLATVVARDLGRPRGITGLPNGDLVLVDLARDIVSSIDPTAPVPALTLIAGQDGVPGSANGTGAAAQFDRPYGVALLPNGDILFADQTNNSLREVTLGGVVTTYAGTGAIGTNDGAKAQATFYHPEDVAVDAAGNVYVDDHDNQLIRLISPTGTVSTIAGGLPAGFKDGPGLTARFYGQEGIALAPDGKTLYVADGTNGDDSNPPYDRVRAINLP